MLRVGVPRAETLRIAALFAGQIDDKGFMEAGYRGLTSARDKLGVDIVWRDRIKPERDLLIGALRAMAAAGADLVIAHRGQNNEAAKTVASDFPSMSFVVTQGSVTGPGKLRGPAGGFCLPRGALAGWATLDHLERTRVPESVVIRQLESGRSRA